MRIRNPGTFFFLSTLVLASYANAQTPRALPTFELERLTFNPSQQSSLLIGTGDLMPERKFRASLILHYQHDPLVLFEDKVRVGSVVKSRLTAHLLAAFGITRWLEASIQLPIVVYQAGDSPPQIVTPATAALGTPWLSGSVALLSQAKQQPLDLALSIGLSIPWGNSAALTRDPSVGATVRVGAGRSFGLLRAGAEVGALIRKGAVLSPGQATVGDEVGSTLLLAANLVTTHPGLRGELAVLGWVPFTRAKSSMEVMLGGRYPLGPIELFAIAGPGFGSAPGTPSFRVMLGAGLTLPRESAAPVVAVAPVNRCVEGQPYSPAECPELDTDRDGIADSEDACPTIAGPKENSGCPNKDSDGDGLLDREDKCPTVKGLVAFAGCPDSDLDGVPDAEDSCPKVPGAKENKGCPWPDTDGDGVNDHDDACPKEAGPADRKGCPVKDADGDTVPDEVDNCPTLKGPVENQGCPKERVQLVIITRDRLIIKEKVFFDTGKATIKPRSFPLLIQVSEILTDHPEIPSIVIEGHTDSQGKAEANRKLSQQRAESVRAFLVQHNVEASRLEAKGYGPDRPAQSNMTAAGREANRRVEFVVKTAETTQTKGVAP